MIETAQRTGKRSIEDSLRAELARGDAVASTIAPILRHLLANDDSSMFSDGILARVRGCLEHLAIQMLDALGKVGGSQHLPHELDTLCAALLDDGALLAHLHAAAIEWQLTERLEERLALDPVVPPLVQALVASPDSETQSLAMKLLAAQARWCQSQRRMQLPLYELPGELLHVVLLTMRSHAQDCDVPDERAALAEAQIRSGFDEGASRLGLAARLVLGMANGAVAALSIAHAGVTLFLSALAMGSEQERDAVTLTTYEGQLARLALALRVAGLKPAAIEQQFLALQPDTALPESFDRLSVDAAAAILASGRFTGP